MHFKDFDIIDALKDRLASEKIENPTDIQEKAIPEILSGKDVIGLAQTGTGKTFAFLIPILNDLLNDDSTAIQALILAPTRELVTQIVNEAERLSPDDFTVAEIIGGTDYAKQRHQLKTARIVVATPGRLIDFIQQGMLKLDQVRYMVLDEADRMLDMGFINDIKTIISRTPKERQTLMFSATMPYEVYYLAYKHMKDPIELNVSQDSLTTDNIDQQLYHLGREEKMPYLVNQILEIEGGLILIFTNMRVFVDEIVHKLLTYGIPARGISSLLPQNKRSRLMEDYRNGKIRVLVATDVASRGIDVDGITHVFNYDLPQSAENYVHRIGRTARAGRRGISISYCSEFDYDDLQRIEKLLGDKIPTQDVSEDFTSYPKGEFENLAPPRSRGSRDSRGSRGSDSRRSPRGRDDRGGRGERPRRSSGRDERKPVRSGSRPEKGEKAASGEGRSNDRNKRRKAGSGQGTGRGDDNRRSGGNRSRRGGGNNRQRAGRVEEQASNESRENMKRISHHGPAQEKKKGLWGKIKSVFKK